jgi:exonuclease III
VRGVGIIISWVGRSVQLSNVHLGDRNLMAWVAPARGDPWWLTCVYGPQAEPDKIAFLAELREVREARRGPWVVCGDFNLIYQAEDKNNANLNHRMMGRF